MSSPVYVLEGGSVKDPSIQGVEAQISKLGCFHSIDCIEGSILGGS